MRYSTLSFLSVDKQPDLLSLGDQSRLFILRRSGRGRKVIWSQVESLTNYERSNMAKQSRLIPILPYWDASDDVLLKALLSNGGKLISGLKSVGAVFDTSDRSRVRLDLRYSDVTDDGLEAIAGMVEVRDFTSSKQMTDAGLVHLREMVDMVSLELSDITIRGDGLKHLAGMSQLQRLQIVGCTITDSALAYLPHLPALTMINFSTSTGFTDAAWECLTRLEQLQHFSLNGATKAGGPGLRCLSKLRHLHTLDFSSGSRRITTDDDLSHLPELPSVEHLDLKYTLITDSGLAYLTRLPNLKTLNLEMTAVGDVGMSHLAELAKLERLNLDDTKVGDVGLGHVASLPRLESVSLNRSGVSISAVMGLKSARPGINLSAIGCTGGPPPEPEKLELIQRLEFREAAPVARSWERIEAWFAEYLPQALTTLNPPATEADLDALEKSIGRRLPPDFRASYLIHDGQSYREDDLWGMGVFFGLAIEPINRGEGITWLYRHRVECEWPEKSNEMLDWIFYPPDAIREAWSGPGWLPFYWDAGRNFIGIDLEPGPNGVYGQVIRFGLEDEYRPVLALSFAHLLEDIADELEAGHAVTEPSEVSNSPFRLKGGPKGYFQDVLYKAWAEAKLPLAFQQAKPIPRFVPTDHATGVSEELASSALDLLRNFLSEMNRLEQHWLTLRPIHEYQVHYLQETKKGFQGIGYQRPRPGEAPVNHIQAIICDPKAPRSKMNEALGHGKFFAEAIAAKNEVWKRYLTIGPRSGDRTFTQEVPPRYNPTLIVDPIVRQVSPGHIIITYGQPVPPEENFHGDPAIGRLRWHLLLGKDGWRIERYENVDDPAKPRKLELQ